MFDTNEAPVGAIRWPQPGEVWSLWEMLKLYATSFLAIGEHLGTVDVFMALNEHQATNEGSEGNGSADESSIEELPDLTYQEWEEIQRAEEQAERLRNPRDALASVVELAQRMELLVSAELIRGAVEGYSKLTLGEYRLLKKALYTEIKGKSLFYIPRERVSHFENDRILSDPAKRAFNTAYVELREAGCCFAVGRFTGCVLHAMRAAEVGVKSMSRALGYNPPELDQQDWHPVLNKCESLIQEMRDGLKKSPEKEALVQFYSQAAAQFRHFKDGWRVQAAHARPPFNESEARIILDATISFFEVLALRLSESAAEPPAP